MLSAAEIAAMRKTSDAALPDTCVIQERTRAKDNMGGGSSTWVNSGTVACRVAPGGLSPSGPVIGEQVRTVGDFVATLPAGTIVPKTARIAWQGVTFEVMEIPARSWEMAVRVAMRKT